VAAGLGGLILKNAWAGQAEAEGQQSRPSSVTVPISFGELIDKITILEIKTERIADQDKLHNVRHELSVLTEILSACGAMPGLVFELKDEVRRVNEALWDIENGIRGCEHHQDFGERFVELARCVYVTNDHRAEIKRQINKLCGSTIVEEKAYTAYTPVIGRLPEDLLKRNRTLP
jgi:Family of unknown function (DUF6165)